MYYAVNLDTKEHKPLKNARHSDIGAVLPGSSLDTLWVVIQSDEDGWLPLVRKERPVPHGQDVLVKLEGGGALYYACASRVPDWSLVSHYCFPAEQKPVAVETDAQPAPSINGQYEYVKIGSAEQRWWKVTIIAYDEGAPVGKTEAGRYRRLPLDKYRFRSPRTNRERWCEMANQAWMSNTERRSTFEVIHDALLTGALEAPKPEDTSS